MSNHYDWLNKNFNKFTKSLGFKEDLTGLISAHGDKAYQYEHLWKEKGIPFEHGVAMYLLTYVNPYAKQVRETANGWINPCEWVIENYPRFKINFNLLTEIKENNMIIHCRTHEFGPTYPRIRVWTKEMAAYGQFNVVEWEEMKKLKETLDIFQLGQIKAHDCDGMNPECHCPILNYGDPFNIEL